MAKPISTIHVSELCKVRNSAVGRAGNGYSLALFKKANKASARIVVFDASFVPGKQLLTVDFHTLWKLKTSQRKALERKVAKACAPPVLARDSFEHMNDEQYAPPLFAKIESLFSEKVLGLSTPYKVTLGGSQTVLYIAFDSVVTFTGDAIVNAANEGCLGGGGIDGEVNIRGGIELHKARQALPLINAHHRCKTGDAKITVAGNLPCSKVIHTVGPRFGCSPELAHHADNLDLLESAYKSAMERACENGLKSVGFCILSAGIFRGDCPLNVVIQKGLETIAKNVYPGLETVVFCGFTPSEQSELSKIAVTIAKDSA